MFSFICCFSKSEPIAHHKACTHTHTWTLTCTHACTCEHIHVHACIQCTCTPRPYFTHTHACTHTRMHTCKEVHPCNQDPHPISFQRHNAAVVPVPAHQWGHCGGGCVAWATCFRGNSGTQWRACMHACTHTYAHTHSHTLTHTYTESIG